MIITKRSRAHAVVCMIAIFASSHTSSVANAFIHSVVPTSTTLKATFGKSTQYGYSNGNKQSFGKDLTTLYYRNNSDDIDSTKEDTSNSLQQQQQQQQQQPMKSIEAEEKEIIVKEIQSESNNPYEKVMGIFNSAMKQRNDNKDESKISPLPISIQDTSVLYYDIFLLLNLSVSISFWVVHRLSFSDITQAFSEGSLLCILWIASGLYNGAFLYSATDGHYDMTRDDVDGKGGPKAAGLLGLWTFVGTINMRMLIALVMAVIEHRPVGIADGEELIPLELCFGLVLMSMWRMLHSSYTRV
jgi:hypothetical protein